MAVIIGMDRSSMTSIVADRLCASHLLWSVAMPVKSTLERRRLSARVGAEPAYRECAMSVPATTQRPQRSTRSQGQLMASQRATASASGTSRLELSARTQDCTATSHSSEAEGYR